MAKSEIKINSKNLEKVLKYQVNEIVKDKQKEISLFLKTIKINAPIKLGDVVYDKPLGIDCKIIATRDLEVKK